MIKYHKILGFKAEDIQKAENLIKSLKNRAFRFSSHCLEELTKESEAESIGKAIISYSLALNDVFELALENGIIEKIGFRIPFKNRDIIFILSKNKVIITAWTNKAEDLHYTLNKNNYSKP